MNPRQRDPEKVFEVSLSGDITRDDVLSLWQRLAAEDRPALIDLRRATGFFSTRDIPVVAFSLPKLNPQRRAFLCRSDDIYGSVRMLSALAAPEDGFGVFRSEDSAVNWLAT